MTPLGLKVNLNLSLQYWDKFKLTFKPSFQGGKFNLPVFAEIYQ